MQIMLRFLFWFRRWTLSRWLWLFIGITLVSTGLSEAILIAVPVGIVFVILAITGKGCGSRNC